MTDFEKVCDFGNLYQAFKDAKSGKGFKESSARFDVRALDGIQRVKQLLESRTYKISRYHQFYVYEPKKRLIMSNSFVDKIVQHSLCDNVLMPRLKDVFIQNNFAGQKGKGTQFGREALKDDMLNFYNQHGMNGYILKADITKYYYSIDHDILKRILRKYFDDEGVLWLCDLIIDSVDNPGLPLGNQTSQVFGLLYLNGVDHYIVERLGIQYYGRYTDDLYLFHQDKEYLKYCLQSLTALVSKLRLTFNGKTQIMPFKQGVKFLGAHTYIRDGKVVSKLKNENRRNAYKRYRRLAKLVLQGKEPEDKLWEKFQSWAAHAEKCESEVVVEQLRNEIKEILEQKND